VILIALGCVGYFQLRSSSLGEQASVSEIVQAAIAQGNTLHKDEVAYRRAMRKADGEITAQAAAAHKFGIACAEADDLEKAEGLFRTALALYESKDDLKEVAKSYGNLGNIGFYSGDFEMAADFYTKSLAMNETVPDIQPAIYDLDIYRQ